MKSPQNSEGRLSYYGQLLFVPGLHAIVYIALSCVSAVVPRSVLSSNNKVDDIDDDDMYDFSNKQSLTRSNALR